MAYPLNSESTEEIREALEKNDHVLAVSKIKEYLKKEANTPLNIAITGESGSGKSSFVNAFRGIDHRDERAAPTGCVETTMEVKEYIHPNYSNVALWDLPGIGTTNFPADKYLEHVKFQKYDFFIIISDTRFSEKDAMLAQQIQDMDKKFYFIRSKIDNDLLAAERSQRNFNAEKTLEEIRNDCIQHLIKEGVESPQVFLLSNFDLQKHDFHLLHETLERELPEHKKNALLLAMPNISPEIIDKKKALFKAKIMSYAFLSAAGAVVPLPGLSLAVDGGLLAGVVRQYKVGFGLDSESLKRLSDSTGVPFEELYSVIRSPIALNKISVEFILKLLCQSANTAALMIAEQGFSFIPIFGTLVAATLSYKVTEIALHNFLEMFAEDAHRVFKRALGGLNIAV